MKLSQLSLADYNKLDSIPVINQDLSASGFTPVANTYYRHTGATTDTFTQGVIYLYDTAYHKLGESITLKNARYLMNDITERENAINLLKDKRKSIVAIYVNNDDRYNWHCDNISTVGSTEMAMLSTTKYAFNSDTNVSATVFEMVGISVNKITSNTLSINTDGSITNSQVSNFRSVTIYYI